MDDVKRGGMVRVSWWWRRDKRALHRSILRYYEALISDESVHVTLEFVSMVLKAAMRANWRNGCVTSMKKAAAASWACHYCKLKLAGTA